MPQINGQEVGPLGYGMMGLTWRETPPSEEQAFAAMRAALDSGMNFFNGGEIYGTPEYNSLVLLERYLARYPEDADRIVLSVKGAAKDAFTPDASAAGIRRSVDNCLRQLGGRKTRIDVFECARRDMDTPLEETFGTLQKEYVDTGKVGGISLSEVGAQTIRDAVKIAKIVAVEVELSLWSTDVLTNGIAAACAENGIPLIAYSPIGRGMLTGQFKSVQDVPQGDLRKYMPRFQPGNFEINLQLVEQVEQLAKKKGCTPAQLAINWVRCLSRRPGMPTIIPIPGATTAERVRENSKIIDLTDAEMQEIDDTLAKFEVKGGRYPDGAPINS